MAEGCMFESACAQVSVWYQDEIEAGWTLTMTASDICAKMGAGCTTEPGTIPSYSPYTGFSTLDNHRLQLAYFYRSQYIGGGGPNE